MTEVWKDIPGYDGRYQVSNTGFVRIPFKRDLRGRPSGPRILKTTVNVKGYHRVQLTKGGKPRKFSVHALVLEVFVGPRPLGAQALHGPAGNGENSLENLRWGSVMENAQDRKTAGNYASEKSSTATIDAATARRIKERIADGITSRRIAGEFGVTKFVVDMIRCGRTWREA